MARISRIVAVGYPHHITQRGVRSMDIFDSDSDRNTYLQFIKEELQRYEIDVLSWCLMINYAHSERRQEQAARQGITILLRNYSGCQVQGSKSSASNRFCREGIKPSPTFILKKLASLILRIRRGGVYPCPIWAIRVAPTQIS
jgi:hypothetical protein